MWMRFFGHRRYARVQLCKKSKVPPMGVCTQAGPDMHTAYLLFNLSLHPTSGGHGVVSGLGPGHTAEGRGSWGVGLGVGERLQGRWLGIWTPWKPGAFGQGLQKKSTHIFVINKAERWSFLLGVLSSLVLYSLTSTKAGDV